MCPCSLWEWNHFTAGTVPVDTSLAGLPMSAVQPRPQGLLLIQNGGSFFRYRSTLSFFCLWDIVIGFHFGVELFPVFYFFWSTSFVLTEGTKNSWGFCHVKHDEMAAFCLNNSFRLQENKQSCQTLEITSEKAIPSCVTWPNTPRFLEYFSSLDWGFLRSAILNEKKALGTRLSAVMSVANDVSGNHYKVVGFVVTDYEAALHVRPSRPDKPTDIKRN